MAAPDGDLPPVQRKKAEGATWRAVAAGHLAVLPEVRCRLWQRCRERVTALMDGHEVVTVPEGFDTYHQRLTRIHWAPIGKALTPGESS